MQETMQEEKDETKKDISPEKDEKDITKETEKAISYMQELIDKNPSAALKAGAHPKKLIEAYRQKISQYQDFIKQVKSCKSN